MNKVTCPNPLCRFESILRDFELKYTKYGREFTCQKCGGTIRIIRQYKPPLKDQGPKLSKKERRRLNARRRREKEILEGRP
jgi:hypothetical protein